MLSSDKNQKPPQFSDPRNWQEWYLQHRNRVLNAKSVVNSLGPQNVEVVEQPLTFMDLLEELINCVPNKTQTFTKSLATNGINNFVRRNYDNLPKRKKLARRRRKKAKKNQIKPEPPVTESGILVRTIKRYDAMDLPQDLLSRLLRPRIYWEMFLKDMRPLGTVVIQLFTEACPSVVMEFVRACNDQKGELFTFNRLFPPLWLEGELLLRNSMALDAPLLEHDMSVLDHGSRRGILSFPCRYLRGSKRCFLSFSISLKPLEVLNGRRVAFGVIKDGLWVLDTIQKYGTSTGKPTKPIIVSRCTVQF